MALRECPYCGKKVYDQLTQCNYCRETLPEKRHAKSSAAPAGGEGIRRGLLFMLLAAIIGYFVSGSSSPWSFPVPVPQLVGRYLLPLLFLSGLAMSLHGLYLRHRSSH